MATPRVVALRASGTNCHRETVHAFNMAGAQAEHVHINHLLKSKNPLAPYQIVALCGGFTYGDDVAAGKILAVELDRLLGEHLQNFVECGGLIIGICNGFQVLIKTGLLPYAEFRPAAKREYTLAHNVSHRFEARWVKLEAPKNTRCLFVEPGEILEMPVAHGEGRLVGVSPAAVKRLNDNGLVTYRYIAQDGGKNPVYPDDPNGSVDYIAGISDPTGRIFGLMPHPERHIYARQHPNWTREQRDGEGDGLRIFRRAVNALK